MNINSLPSHSSLKAEGWMATIQVGRVWADLSRMREPDDIADALRQRDVYVRTVRFPHQVEPGAPADPVTVAAKPHWLTLAVVAGMALMDAARALKRVPVVLPPYPGHPDDVWVVFATNQEALLAAMNNCIAEWTVEEVHDQ